MRVLIVGGRDFIDYNLLEKELKIILNEVNTSSLNDLEIVSGDAVGADSMGIDYAVSNGINYKIFPAYWKDFTLEPCEIKYNETGEYNSLAGRTRNQRMADYIKEEEGIVIAFWDGVSKGTKDMIDRSKELGLKVYIVRYEN